MGSLAAHLQARTTTSMPLWKWHGGHVLIGLGAFTLVIAGPRFVARLLASVAAMQPVTHDVATVLRTVPTLPYAVGALATLALSVYLELPLVKAQGPDGDTLNDLAAYNALPLTLAAGELAGLLGAAIAFGVCYGTWRFTIPWARPGAG